MVPAEKLPVPEILDDSIGADRITRVKDSRGNNYVEWFPQSLKKYLTGHVKGRKDPIRKGARAVRYQVAECTRRGAEMRAKRHLRRPETRKAMWERLTRQDEEDPVEPKPTRRLRGKQNASLGARGSTRNRRSGHVEQ